MKENCETARNRRSALCVAACAGVPDAALQPGALAWHIADGERLAAAMRAMPTGRDLGECCCPACLAVDAALAAHAAGPGQGNHREKESTR